MLEKTPESPLDSREIKPVDLKGNQPWLLIGRTDAEAETPILWPLVRRVDSLEKSLMLEKIEGRRRRGRQRVRRLDGITDAMNMNLGKLQEMVAWYAAVHGVTESRTWLGGWTTTMLTHWRLYLGDTLIPLSSYIFNALSRYKMSLWKSKVLFSRPYILSVHQQAL